jgi:hypothetical protein
MLINAINFISNENNMIQIYKIGREKNDARYYLLLFIELLVFIHG